MKYIAFLGDGMADRPNELLGYKTPLEAANKPNIDYMASKGVSGMVKTVPEGMKPGSDVANLGVMGFDARAVYTGRAPLEALSIGIDMKPSDVAVRCNLVTLSDDKDFSDKTMLDYSAGEITTEEAHELIAAVNAALADEKYTFYGGVSYRNCLIAHGGDIAELTAPHDISGMKIGDYLPQDTVLKSFIERSYEILKDHPVNKAREAAGKNPANAVWLWGAGTKPCLPSFKSLYGLKGAVISAVDLLKGIAIAADMDVIDVDGATGTLNTNWDGKAEAAVKALSEYDYVYLHMEAPDECGHQGDAEGKVKAIEFVDYVVGKVMSEADSENLTVLIMPDHPTPLDIKTHSSEAVPFVMYRLDLERDSGIESYTEANAASTGVKFGSGKELMQAFLDFGSGSFEESDLSGAAESEIAEANIAADADIDAEAITAEDNDLDIISEESESREETDEEDNGGADAVEEIDDSQSDESPLSETDITENEDSEIYADAAVIAENAETSDDTEEDVDADIEAVEGEETKSEMILLGGLPPIDGESEETDESDEPKKTKKAKKDKKAKAEKAKKEKKPLTKKQKQTRIIAISVSAVLLAVIIVLSIVLPIVILNKDKIFVSSAEDFNKVDKGKYFVLDKDVEVNGDLTLPRAYTIDMNGHNLTVNGTMTIAETAETNAVLNIGTKDGKGYSNDGILKAKTFKITYNGKLEFHSMLVTDNLELDVRNADFKFAVQARETFTANGTNAVFGDGLAFGESGHAALTNSTVTLSGEAKADYELNTSKIFVTEGASTKNILLDEFSEAHIKGAVDGNIEGGAKVVLGKTASAKELSRMEILWLHDDAKYDAIVGGVKVSPIIELTAPPTISVTLSNSGRIIVNVKTVSNASRYECTVNGEVLPLVTVDKADQNATSLVTFDITEIAEKHIGEMRISVRALGAESEDDELVIPSEPTAINYQHKITLETPKNALVSKTSDGKYILSYSSVNFANKYKIEINGKQVIETKETSVDISAYLNKVGNYSIFVHAVNSDNASILSSEKALTGIEVRGRLEFKEKSLIVNDDGTITLYTTADNAKDMVIEYTDADGNERQIRKAFSESVNLGKLSPDGKVYVTLIGHGYYDESGKTPIN